MQTSELEKKNNKLTDEECINFRPSPNFKHMRKYLKPKFKEANSPNQSSDRSTTPNSEESESGKPQATSSSMAQRVQPPLPPNSPPPELVIPKQEVVDEEYNDKIIIQSEFKIEKAPDKVVERTMCRQYARGMCTRGATCIYVHELILSQLPGVYTFCKNFQNSNCTFPKCKFVHASVFEKEHFYRTGFLPPHTLAHLKESNSALGPPTVLEGTPAEASQAFPISNPPPVMHPGVSTLPTSGCAPWGAPAEARPKTEIFGGFPPTAAQVKLSSPNKREWSEMDIAPELDSTEPMPKKCKNCDYNDMRLRLYESKLEKLMATKEKYSLFEKELMKCDSSADVVFEGLATLKKLVPGILNNGIPTRNEKVNLQTSMFDQIRLLNSRVSEADVSQKIFLQHFLKMFKEVGLDNC